MSDDALDMSEVTIEDAERLLGICFRHNRPAMLWGQPGIGKSELIAQIAKNGSLGDKVALYDVRLLTMEPTDLRGMPFQNAMERTEIIDGEQVSVKTTFMDWSHPIDLPFAEDAAKYDRVILFLDELSAAPPMVQTSAYQLTLDRKVGTYKLPDNVVVVAAGNRIKDKGGAFNMQKPLSNRLIHFTLKVDFDSWFKYAIKAGAHPDVLGYLGYNKEALSDFTKKSGEAFATPRTWMWVSDWFHDPKIRESDLYDLVAGTVGQAHAGQLMAHRQYAASLPDPSEILDGKVTTFEHKEHSALYSLALGMCFELKDRASFEGPDKKAVATFKKTNGSEDEWHKQADRFLKVMLNTFPEELSIMAAREAVHVYNLPFDPNKLKNFDEFFERFGGFVAKALNG